MSDEVLSIREAARRVHRSRRTIHRWLSAGMPWHQRPGDPTKWIHLADLQAVFIARLDMNPTRPRTAASLEHGTRNRYRAGCRCQPCRDANAAYEKTRYVDGVRRARERRTKEKQT